MLDGLGFWAIIIYIVITSIGTIILSPVPGVSMAFILAGCGLFGKWVGNICNSNHQRIYIKLNDVYIRKNRWL